MGTICSRFRPQNVDSVPSNEANQVNEPKETDQVSGTEEIDQVEETEETDQASDTETDLVSDVAGAVSISEILEMSRPFGELVLPEPNEIPSCKDFKMIRKLGHGLHGQVYLVVKLTNVDSGVLYAMKVYDKKKRNATESAVKERIILEKVAGLPFLADLCYAFQENSKMFLVLKLAKGGSLAEVLEFRHLNLIQTRNYLAELILAVYQLHSLKIIHRDLKPENIVLDRDNHLQLVDLSVSTIIQGHAIRGVYGTVPYMAPELLQTQLKEDSSYSKEIDWWSIGVLAIQLFTGKLPFEGKCNAQTAVKIVSSPPVIPLTIKGDMLNFVMRLLVKDPARRLGASEGAMELLRHPFFNETNWAKISSKIKSRTVLRDGFVFKSPVFRKGNYPISGFEYVSPTLLFDMRSSNQYTKAEAAKTFECQDLSQLLAILKK